MENNTQYLWNAIDKSKKQIQFVITGGDVCQAEMDKRVKQGVRIVCVGEYTGVEARLYKYTNKYEVVQSLIAVEEKPKEVVRIFTYGTLMFGNCNNFVLGEEAVYCGDAILEGYKCFGLEYGYPMIIEGEGQVLGEVWQIPLETLADVDMLEGYSGEEFADYNLYRREYRQVEIMDTGEEEVMGVYVWNSSIPSNVYQVPNCTKWNKRNIYK